MSYNRRIETSREIRQWIYLIGAAGASAYALIPAVRRKIDGWVNRLLERRG